MQEVNTTVFGAAFAVYTLIIVGVGLYSAKRAKRSDEDYFLAGRSLGKWIAALSASASSESGWVTLGLVGWAYGSGMSAYWIIPGCLLGYMFNWWVIAGRMRDRAGELNALTLPDLFAFHYKERLPILRVLSVVVILVAMTLYVAAQFNAAGKAFEYCFSEHLNYKWGVLIGAAVVLIYTVTGGFRAVCWTDFLQALLMVTALVVFPVYLLATHGGYGAAFETLRSAGEDDLLKWIPAGEATGAALVGFLIGHGALGINFGYPGQPHVLIRFMGLKDRRDAKIAGVIAVVWGLLIYWGAVTVGLLARAMTVEGQAWATALTDGDLGLVASAMHLLPAVVGGLVLAAVLAAICSTADSQLVVAASSAANDLFRRLIDHSSDGAKTAPAHSIINRGTVLVLGVIAVLLVIDKESEIKVYEYVLTYGWAVLGAAFGPQVILMLLWRRSSYAGCIAGMATGFIVAIVWKLTYMDYRAMHPEAGLVHVYNLPLAFVVALVVNILVSLMTPPRPSQHGA
ncbi:MAG: sodium/proline symporter [Phycisphaerales bacterium]|nr:sodium/proline symporter [Phycisphaerales bacterium]